MDYIIGRDAITSQLKIAFGSQIIRIGAQCSVPQTVSREHVRLSVGNDGKMRITNLKPLNVTFVNGHSVESKGITASDSITLGSSHYHLDLTAVLAAIQKVMPKVVDIRPLKDVWDKYYKAQLDARIRQGKFVALSSGTGLITMAAVVLSFMGVGLGVRIACYVVAAVFILITIITRYQNATKLPLQQEEWKKWLRNNYKCPSCGHSFNMDYDTLSQYDNCPYCKAKFKK